MRTHTTHQVLASTDASTTEARVAAATARVQAGMDAGTAQTGQEEPKHNRLTVTEVGVFVAAGVTVAFALLFVVQTLIGWFTPMTGTDGICREYNNQVVVCAPAHSPDGAEMTRMWEDGSAVYVDGYVFGGYSES